MALRKSLVTAMSDERVWKALLVDQVLKSKVQTMYPKKSQACKPRPATAEHLNRALTIILG
jgi:hypothetical protein